MLQDLLCSQEKKQDLPKLTPTCPAAHRKLTVAIPGTASLLPESDQCTKEKLVITHSQRPKGREVLSPSRVKKGSLIQQKKEKFWRSQKAKAVHKAAE